MAETVVCGIDPGLSGGVAILGSRGDILEGFRTPLCVDAHSARGKKIVDSKVLYARIACFGVSAIVIERVHAMPGQGVTSMFSFGQAFGMALAVATTLLEHSGPVQVTPQAWKKHFGLAGSSKGDSIQAATKLFRSTVFWPHKADNGIAEAALLARWWLDQQS